MGKTAAQILADKARKVAKKKQKRERQKLLLLRERSSIRDRSNNKKSPPPVRGSAALSLVAEDKDEASQSGLVGGFHHVHPPILALDPNSPAGLQDSAFGGWLYTRLISPDEQLQKQGIRALLNLITANAASKQFRDKVLADVREIFLDDFDGNQLSESLIERYAIAKSNNDKTALNKIVHDAYLIIKPNLHIDDVDLLIRSISESPENETGERRAGNILASPIIHLTSENPVELRDAIQKSYTMSKAIWISPKGGGKNLPGAYGANYSFPVIELGDEVPHFDNTVFYKQTTEEDDTQNYQESIAEVLAGNSINDVAGAYSGLALTSTSPDYPGAPAPTTDYVYIGSLFHKKYVSLRSAAYVEGLGMEKAPPKKGGKTPSDFWLKKFKKGLLKVISGDPHLEQTFGEAIASNLDVGNSQFHSENLGFAIVNGKRSVVSLDYGGAFRRPYRTSYTFATKIKKIIKTAPVKIGRFERNLDPTSPKGLKYERAYLNDYPKKLLTSPGFLKGFGIVTDRKLLALSLSLNTRVEQAIKLYGPEVFFDEFVSKLDTRSAEQNFFNNINKSHSGAVAQAAIDFLFDARIGRQLSMKEFVIRTKLSASKRYPQADIVIDNPAYALQNKLTDMKTLAAHPTLVSPDNISRVMLGDFGLLQIKDNAQALESLLEAMIIRLKAAAEVINEFDANAVPQALLDQQIELLAWRQYLQTALDSKMRLYDLTSADDRKTLVLACDEAFRQIRDTLALITDPAHKKDFQQSQKDITPDFIPENAAVAEKYLQDMKVKAHLIPVPMPVPPSPTSVGSNSSASSIHSRSPSRSPSSARRSSHSYNFFSHNASNNPPVAPDDLNKISKSLVTYVKGLENQMETDRSARLTVKEFFKSHLGRALEFVPDIAKLKDILNRASIKLPAGVLRAPIVDTANFDLAQQSSAQALNSNTAPSLVNGQTVMSYIVGPQGATGASYAGTRKNNDYAVRAISLEAALDRQNIITEILRSPDINVTLTDAEIKKITKFYRRYEYDLYSQDPAVKTNAYDTFVAKCAGFPVLADKVDCVITAMANAVKRNATTGAPPDLFISDAYIDYAEKQIREYIAEAGSNGKINIDLANDPYLVSAYVAVSQALHLDFLSDNKIDVIPASPAAIARLQAAPIVSVKEGLKQVVADLTTEVNADPAIDDDVKTRVNQLQTVLTTTGKVSVREMYNVVDEIHTVRPRQRLRSI